MNYSRFITISVSATMLALIALPAFAATSVSSAAAIQVNPNVIMHVTPVMHSTAVSSAPISISARIQALQALLTRINSATLVSSSMRSSVVAAIEAQIARLQAMESNGATPTASAGPVAVSSAANASFYLVLSNGAIASAADHFLAVAGQLANFSAKLQVRINQAQNVDTTSLTATLADMNSQIAAAKAAANAALADVANLGDNSSAPVSASTSGSLRDAAAQLTKARTAIAAAYQDASTILKGLGVTLTPMTTSANVSSSANVNVQ